MPNANERETIPAPAPMKPRPTVKMPKVDLKKLVEESKVGK